MEKVVNSQENLISECKECMGEVSPLVFNIYTEEKPSGRPS